jgi:two-component system, chemotaxis family, CheB/CheR fusion protein
MSPEPAAAVTESGTDEQLERLLAYLKAERAFDFTGYKRSSLARRITKRLEAVHCSDYGTYLDYLEVHPEEFAHLFNTILINVTGFYRDPDSWQYLTDEILPRLIESKRQGEPIRVWSAGCATGEETYTAAMILSELMGEAEYLDRVKIYATDVDDDALDEARAATYTHKQIETVPAHMLERCFERSEARCAFRKDLRRTVIFGRNDLVQDAPISRIDLLMCRNTLMYFNAETQARILGRFYFALQPEGCLFMGKSEMLITHSDLFTPINLKRRVFAKVVKQAPVDRFSGARAWQPEAPGPAVETDGADALRHLVLESAPVAQVVVDAEQRIVLVNQRARTLMGVGPAEVGLLLKDLEVSYRPFELRSQLDQVLAAQQPLALDAMEVTTPSGELRLVEVLLTPLSERGQLLGASVAFTDVTSRRRLQEELQASRLELENSYEELQSTVEELETTNEELQSTNEELETTNEELQSTNEELETMNEELQSTNEELETINDELRQRGLELNRVNVFLETILTSLGMSVVVLDASLRVEVWNAHSEEMWGLRPSEVVGEHFLNLDIGLPVDTLKRGIRACLDGTSERVEESVEATNRRGRTVAAEVVIVPVQQTKDETTGVILLIAETLSPVPASL